MMNSAGKGSKPRPIKNYTEFANNWDEIIWDDFVNCAECGMPHKLKNINKEMRKDTSGDWVCMKCNFN